MGKVIHCLNNHHVEYLMFGGHAVNYHGYDRSTFDMDLKGRSKFNKMLVLPD